MAAAIGGFAAGIAFTLAGMMIIALCSVAGRASRDDHNCDRDD